VAPDAHAGGGGVTALPAGLGRRRGRAGDATTAAGVLAVAAAAGYCAGTGRATAVIALLVALGTGALVLLWPERAAVGLLVVLPFCAYPAAVGGFSVFAALPVALGAAAGLAVLQRPRGPITLPVLPFAALLALALISALHSQDPTTGASRILYLVGFGLLAWTLAGAVQAGLITPVTVARALVAGAALAAIALLAQFMYGMAAGRDAVTTWLASMYPLFGGQRSGATQTPNWWIPSLSLTRAIFPFMAAPSAGVAMMTGLLAAVWLRGARVRGLWIRVALVLTAVALLATFSRQAWIGVLAGLLVLGARRGRRGVLALLGLLALLLLVVPVPGHDASFAGYLASSADTSTTSTGTRLGLLQQAVQFVGQRPLLGIGPGQYSSLNPDPGAHPIFYAHNVVLDVAVELGVLGAVAFLALFGTAIVAAWRRQADLAAALLVAYLVAGLFDDVLYFPRNGFVLAAAFGLSAGGRAR
jgi:O-antigen ligase